jgi:DNA-binding response OmpR family regulator
MLIVFKVRQSFIGHSAGRTMPKLLVVEDDFKMSEMIVDWFSAQGFAVESCDNGVKALSLMRSYEYDVIILDWDLPGHTGPDICKDYRDGGGSKPILMLTGKGAIEQKERGFLSGADDYLTKPFHAKELSLRVRSLLGRTVATDKKVVRFEELLLDLSKASISVGSVRLNLTAREFALLEFFIRHPESVFDANTLIQRVWESESEVGEKAVRICIARLRDKLSEHDCPQIITLKGFGYKLTAARQ